MCWSFRHQIVENLKVGAKFPSISRSVNSFSESCEGIWKVVFSELCHAGQTSSEVFVRELEASEGEMLHQRNHWRFRKCDK